MYATQWAPLRFVSGIEEARATPVLWGQAALMMDSGRDAFYVKRADASGAQTVKEYEFREVVPPAQPEYVTKQDLDGLMAEIVRLRDELASKGTASGAGTGRASEALEDDDAGAGEAAGEPAFTGAGHFAR